MQTSLNGSNGASPANHKPLVHKPFTVAAQIDAAIIALTKASGEPMTTGDYKLHSSVKELNAGKNVIDNHVAALHKAGLLKRLFIHRKDQPNVKYAYTLGDGLPPKAIKPKAPAPAPVPKKKSIVTTPADPITLVPTTVKKVAAVRIDVVKSSGRVRIELNGLFIEIGVID